MTEYELLLLRLLPLFGANTKLLLVVAFDGHSCVKGCVVWCVSSMTEFETAASSELY